MAEPYLSELQAIIDGLGVQSQASGDILCKHFFSGAAAYVNGAIFMSLTVHGLALKLPQDDLDTLFDQGAKPLQYFPKAPVKKDYAVLPPDLVADAAGLSDWVARSIAFAAD